MGKQKEQTEVAVLAPKKVELIIPQEIEIGGLKISKAIIQTKIEEVKKMTIEGVEDKKGYEAAVKVKGECVKLRTQAEAWRKDKVKPVNDALTELKKLTDSFGSEAKVGEDYLAGIIQPIEDEKQRIKDEKKLAKQKRTNERIAQLVGFDGKPDDNGNYLFAYDGSLFVSNLAVADWEDDEWQDLIEEIEEAYNVEQESLAKAKEDAAKLVTENANKQKTLRLKELKLEGFVMNEPEKYTKPGTDVEITDWEIDNLSTESWDDKITRSSAAPTDDEDEEFGVPGPSPERSISSGYSGGSISVRSAPESFDVEVPEIELEAYSVNLSFTEDAPFIQFNMGPTFVMRLFPGEAEEKVMASVDPEFATLGDVNKDLRFALIKQAK